MWERIESPRSSKLIGSLLLSKKKGRVTRVRGPSLHLSCEPSLHFPHGDFVYLDHVAFHHVPRHVNCHAEVLIAVHYILIVDF